MYGAKKNGLSVALNPSGNIHLLLEDRNPDAVVVLSDGVNEFQAPGRIFDAMDVSLESLLSTVKSMSIRLNGSETHIISMTGFRSVTSYLRWVAASQNYAALPRDWPIPGGAVIVQSAITQPSSWNVVGLENANLPLNADAAVVPTNLGMDESDKSNASLETISIRQTDVLWSLAAEISALGQLLGRRGDQPKESSLEMVEPTKIVEPIASSNQTANFRSPDLDLRNEMELIRQDNATIAQELRALRRVLLAPSSDGGNPQPSSFSGQRPADQNSAQISSLVPLPTNTGKDIGVQDIGMLINTLTQPVKNSPTMNHSTEKQIEEIVSNYVAQLLIQRREIEPAQEHAKPTSAQAVVAAIVETPLATNTNLPLPKSVNLGSDPIPFSVGLPVQKQRSAPTVDELLKLERQIIQDLLVEFETSAVERSGALAQNLADAQTDYIPLAEYFKRKTE
jgi:hypothetical protein